MSAIRSQLRGQSDTILVIALPSSLVDETVGPIRDEVQARLPNSDGAGLVLDCREVELINSIGITFLLQVQDDCRRRRAGITLAAVPAPIVAFLSRLKLDKRFQRHDTVEDAVATLDRAGS